MYIISYIRAISRVRFKDFLYFALGNVKNGYNQQTGNLENNILRFNVCNLT
jgi:hypothetical protein